MSLPADYLYAGAWLGLTHKYKCAHKYANDPRVRAVHTGIKAARKVTQGNTVWTHTDIDHLVRAIVLARTIGAIV